MVQTERNNNPNGITDNGVVSDPNNIPEMEKGLKIWQAFVGLFGILVTVITLLINQSNKIETQKLRIEFLESVTRDHGLQIKEMASKNSQDYNQINNKLNDIMIMMQNKEDRNKK